MEDTFGQSAVRTTLSSANFLPTHTAQHHTLYTSAIDMGVSCRSATASDRFAAPPGIALSPTNRDAYLETAPPTDPERI